MTFLFYKLYKCQTLSFELVAIERRVDDPAAPTGPVRTPVNPAGKLTVQPKSILATSANRLELERIARTSAAETQQSGAAFSRSGFFEGQLLAARSTVLVQPIPPNLQNAALAAVDEDLTAEGLLDAKTGEVSEEAKVRFSWKRTTTLPTAGIIVKGCLDECDVCEPTLDEEIALELERKKLENEMLKKQIELLDKSQEYRCCPAGEVEEETTPSP